MTRRFEEWSSLGVGATYASRNLIIKNSVPSMAWYLVESQTVTTIDHAFTVWQKQAWRFVEATSSALRSNTVHTPHSVARLILVQDYAEGGRRCLDIEGFASALRARVVRGLFEPNPPPYKNMAYHWIRISYPNLPHNPQQLLLSNCDFTSLHDTVPLFWREVLTTWGNHGDGLRPSFLDTTETNAAVQHCPQQTYQQTRPLPPFDDELWHRSPHRRTVSCTQVDYTLGAYLSLPLGYLPLLHGCFGAPVRDTNATHVSHHTRDRATSVRLARPMSSDSMDAAHDLRVRIERAAHRGLRHVYDLFTGWSPGQTPRLKTIYEIATTGTRNRERLPRWHCEELAASVPSFILEAVDTAAAARRDNPHLTLRQLCEDTYYPPGTHVLYAEGVVSAVATTTQLDAPPHTIALGASYSILPDRTLIPYPSTLPQPTHTPRAGATEVQVWTSTRMPHCEEQREYEERNCDTIRMTTYYGGPAVDTMLLYGTPGPRAFINPSHFALAYGLTDRLRPPFPASALDVYSLYHRSLSYRHSIPRTLNPALNTPATSTTFAHLLQAKHSTLRETRLSMCNASHPNAQHGRREAHELYLTVNDGRPIGNDRCMKRGATRTYCDICWHVDGVLRHETTAHVIRECPYSQLVLDPIIRELARRLVPDHNQPLLATLPCSDILRIFERVYATGSAIDSTIPPVVAANIAGCISRVLFARARNNAPRPTPSTINFSPHVAYADIIAMLRDRVKHTYTYACAQDDNLAILHPGIEEWFAAGNGNVFEWRKKWSAIADEHGNLQLPTSLNTATIGNSGSRGITLAQPRVCARPTLLVTTIPYRGPLPRPCPTRIHVTIRLSVGFPLGTGYGDTHDPTDITDDAWPYARNTPPEYPVAAILRERVSRGMTRYEVKWQNHTTTTWEPADQLANTQALAEYRTRPGAGTFTFVMHGDVARLDLLLACTTLPKHRRDNLKNQRAAMSVDGISHFERHYPSSVGSVVGGRATYRDTRRKGNTFLVCHEIARAYVYGEYYDEVDISRSHFSAVCHSHVLAQRPPPISLQRYFSEPAVLEGDIERELTGRIPHFRERLATYRETCHSPPTQPQRSRIQQLQEWIDKTDVKAKTLFSTLINIHSPAGWQAEFEGCTTICQLISDIQRMKQSVPLHPLCCEYAQALSQNGTTSNRTASLCLAHLDEQALHAVRRALNDSGIQTGLTVNDSITIYRPTLGDVPRHDILRMATNAAATHLQFPVTFAYNPHLRKPELPRPSLHDTLTALGADPASLPEDVHSPKDTTLGTATENPKPNNTPYIDTANVDAARTSNTTCTVCGGTIAQGSARITCYIRDFFTPRYHPRCWQDTYATDCRGLPGWSSLSAQLRASCPLFDHARMARPQDANQLYDITGCDTPLPPSLLPQMGGPEPVVHPDVEAGDTGAGCFPPSSLRRLRNYITLREGAHAACRASASTASPSTPRPASYHPTTTTRCFLPPAPYYLPQPGPAPTPYLLRPITSISYLPAHLHFSSSLLRHVRPRAQRTTNLTTTQPSAFRSIATPRPHILPTHTPLYHHASNETLTLYRKPRALRAGQTLHLGADVAPSGTQHHQPQLRRGYVSTADQPPLQTPLAPHALLRRAAERGLAVLRRLQAALGFHSPSRHSNSEPEAPLPRDTSGRPAQALPSYGDT